MKDGFQDDVAARGNDKLADTRPVERSGDKPAQLQEPTVLDPQITWTHYYGVKDTYSRIDYRMLSPNMTREWVKEETLIPTIPNWGIAPDHRPIVAAIETMDK